MNNKNKKTILLILFRFIQISAKIYVDVTVNNPDQIRLEKDDGEILKTEKCSRSEKAIIISERISCLKKDDVQLIKRGCSFIEFDPQGSYALGSYNYSKDSTELYQYDFTDQKIVLENDNCINYRSKVKGNMFSALLDNKCSDQKPGIIYVVNFTAYQIYEKKEKNVCNMFTVPGYIQDSTIIYSPITTTTAPPATTIEQTTNAITKKTTRNANDTTSIVTRTLTTEKSKDNRNTSSTLTTSAILTPPTIISKCTTINATPKDNETMIIPNTKKKNKRKKLYPLIFVIGGCVLLLILIIIMSYILCKKQKKKKNEEISMEDLYSKPELQQKINRRKSKDGDETKLRLLTGYDEVGAFIEGTYEKRESYPSDPTIEHERSHFDDSNKRKAYLDSVSLSIRDDTYEVIGRSNSFTPGGRKQDNKPLRPPRSDEKVINSSCSSASSSNNTANETESHEGYSNIDDINYDDTVRLTPKVDNSVKRMSSFKPTIKKKQEKNSEKKEIQNDTRTSKIIEPISPLSNAENSNEIFNNPEKDEYHGKDAELLNDNDCKKIDNDNIYEEIWNSPQDRKTETEEIEKRYENLPNTSTEKEKDKNISPSNHFESDRNDNDSGYEEVWSGKSVSRDKSKDIDIKKNDLNEGGKSNPSYTEVEVLKKDNENNESVNTNYVDVDLK